MIEKNVDWLEMLTLLFIRGQLFFFVMDQLRGRVWVDFVLNGLFYNKDKWKDAALNEP